MKCLEFTSLCPVTKQPDFGVIEIEYRPGEHLVETKSLKLYLWSFRDRAQFVETTVDEIAHVFMDQIKPLRVCVTGTFNARGGIEVTSTCTLRRAANEELAP